MKIAVMNYSGNVGKSTLTRHLLAPRMPDAEVIAVETINADDPSAVGEQIPAAEFEALQHRWLIAEDVIVDIGASNVEQFVASMTESEGSHEDFDLYVVPTVAEEKQQRDTCKTIDTLMDLGVPPEKIRLVFNKVDRVRNELVARFAKIFELWGRDQCFVLDPTAVVYQSVAYSMSAEAGVTLAQICADQTDYKALLAQARQDNDKGRLDRYARLLALRQRATGVNRELTAVFESITSGVELA